MTTLFEKGLIVLLRMAGSLLVILGILVAFGWISAEVKRQVQEESEIATKKGLAKGMESDLKRLDEEIARNENEWRARVETTRRRLEADLRDLDRRISETEEKWKEAMAGLGDVRKEARDARQGANQAKAKLEVLEKESAWWDVIFDRQKIVELEKARARYATLDAVAKAWEAARDGLTPKLGQSPLPPLKAARNARRKEIADLLDSASPKVAELRSKRSQLEQNLSEMHALISSQSERVATGPTRRLLADARGKLPIALWVLAGIIFVPMLIKVAFYYVGARFAEKLPAICIMPNDKAPPIPVPPRSAVSIPVDIGPDQEVLVHADFLQSSGRSAQKRTQLFLNWRYPLSSIASGMALLTRITPAGETTTRVVVSPQKDAFGEVGVIEIPVGAAMVVQPRALAGVVQQTASPVRITRHWRLLSPHAWLTLQFRYLVFHGPCKLILKGCRGVRAESPEPGEDRLINQAATLGFSANLNYKNTRCETFVSYFRGKEDLFNDMFAGGPGVFVYEEMPATDRKTGITGRGLEGMVDAFLKAFGI